MIARVNGAPAQGLGIRKQRGANAVAVAHGVRERAGRDPRRRCPRAWTLRRQLRLHAAHRGVGPRDRARAAARGASSRRSSAGCSSARSPPRSTWCSPIPMSLLGTVAVIYFLGFTLNTFTLLGLSLAVGIVVDDAIMVLENIFRHAERAKDRVRAAARGHARDHLRGARRDARRRRHLPARRLHEGDHRQVLPPVRRDALRRGAALAARGDHADAGALLAVPRRVGHRDARASGAGVEAALRRARRAATRARCPGCCAARVGDRAAGRRALRRPRSSLFRALRREFMPSQDQGRADRPPADARRARPSTRPRPEMLECERSPPRAARGRERLRRRSAAGPARGGQLAAS